MENHSDSTVVGPSLVPKLKILRGDGQGTRFTLKFKTRIGRETDNDVILNDPKVSRYHCQITFEDSKWVLTDLGSVNGTLLNGLPVSVPQKLSHGAQLTVGDTVMAFVDPMDAAEQPIDPSATIIGGKLPPRTAKPAAKKSSSAIWMGGVAVVLLLIATVAILLWLRRGSTTPTQPAVKPTIALIRTTPVNKALVLKYEEDFSDSNSGWDDAFGQAYTKQYGNNQYHIEITTSNLVVWGLANRNAADFEMEVEATPQTNDSDITYGFIFRYVDANNYYRFDVSPDGFFLLTKFENGEWHTLVDWTASDAINTGTATNVLKVSAFGNEIIVFANGQELTRITDESFSTGNFGFFTSTFEGEHSWVSFDNLKLWAPDSAQIARIAAPTPAPAQPVQQSAATPSPTENTLAASPTAETTETPATETAITETIALTPTTVATATIAAPTPLPKFVTHDQPLARGETRLAGSIIFPVYDPVRGTYDIFRANTDGSDREQLFAEASQPAANRPGDTIAYRSWKADERGLISQKLGESDHWVFEPFFESGSPTFSANDDFFIFHSRAGRQTPALYRTVGTERDVLRRNSAPIEGDMPAAVPDGRLVYHGCLGNECGIIRTNLDGGDPLALTDTADDTAPAVSPDGKTVAFMSNRTGNWDVFTIGIDGQNLQQLTTGDGSDGVPTWSPDGKNIAFASNRDGEWAIWAISAAGNNEHQLFKTNGSVDGIVQIDSAHSFGWLEEHIVWTP